MCALSIGGLLMAIICFDSSQFMLISMLARILLLNNMYAFSMLFDKAKRRANENNEIVGEIELIRIGL